MPKSHLTAAFQRSRQTKIVATMGPTTTTPEMIEKVFLAGVDVFRMNFSHGTHEDHAARYHTIRALEEKFGRPVCIIGDLQGPKLRVGTFPEGFVMVETGQKFQFDMDKTPGDKTRAYLPHPEIFAAMKPGTRLMIDDGKVIAKALEVTPEKIIAEITTGGKISNTKGVNVPDVLLDLNPLTDKDRRDLECALSLGVDWVALSFVQRASDVEAAREIINGRAAILVKMEKPSAVTYMKEIIDAVDGIMVARGDLGVEVPAETVPPIQKAMVRTARAAGKPVIVATQMLESMITSPTPTRAEASDVATAVYDGADAVMLSAETASGQYPLEAVSIMSRIVEHTEKDPSYRPIMDAQHPDPEGTREDAITAAANHVAHSIGAAAIATYTTSGFTTLRESRERPEVPILCLTSLLGTARRLVLAYGTHTVHTPDVSKLAEVVTKATHFAVRDGIAKAGDQIVITAGFPFGHPGTTNTLHIATVEG